ncbi:MAG: hypothetical protein AAGI45_03415 [Cyanobacteria bacterium P01_H01_bin.26]
MGRPTVCGFMASVSPPDEALLCIYWGYGNIIDFPSPHGRLKSAPKTLTIVRIVGDMAQKISMAGCS